MNKRRDKQDMEHMRSDVRYYLLHNGNDSHKAHEAMIKEYLGSGKMIPYYIRGVKDFITESQQLALEWNRKDQMRKTDRENRIVYEDKVSKIVNMGIDEIKNIYKKYKDEVSHNEKLILFDAYMMIYHDEMNEKNVNNDAVRLFDRISEARFA